MALKHPPSTSTKAPLTGKGQVKIVPNSLKGGSIHLNPKTGK